jgi:hypothetical protein
MQGNDIIQWTFKMIILSTVLRPDYKRARVESERPVGRLSFGRENESDCDRSKNSLDSEYFVK